MAATQVRAVTNSYMLPQGARWTASPRVMTAVVCAAAPIPASATAATTQRPASRIARSAGTSSSGIDPAPSAGSPPPVAGVGVAGTPGPAGADPPGVGPPAALAAPTGVRACCPRAASAARRGRPKLYLKDTATTERE